MKPDSPYPGRFGGLLALASGLVFALVLAFFPPWKLGTPSATAAPQFLLFLGRFHPIVLHLPVALLPVVAGLHLWARWPSGAGLRPVLAPLRWLAALSAVLAACTGLLLAQDGGYSGPIFDWHWRFCLGVAVLCVLLLAIDPLQFRGSGPLRGVVWVAILGTLAAGAHLGGSLSHGENFLSEYAPPLLKPIFTLLPGASTGSAPGRSEAPAPGADDPSFLAARKVMDRYCTECHGGSKSKGAQRLDTPENIAKGGKSGSSVVPGVPEKSLVLTRMSLSRDDKKHMPPDGKAQPTAEEIDTLRQWIADGAPGLPGTAPTPAATAPNPVQSNTSDRRLDSQNASANKHSTPAPPEAMKLTPLTTTAALLVSAAGASADSLADPKGLAGEVLKIFKDRCAECHGKATPEADEFAFIDDLILLRKSEYVNLTNPQASKLYLKVQTGDMPRRTQADKEAKKKKADPLTEEQVGTILSWLNAGAPADSAVQLAGNNTVPPSPQPVPPPQPVQPPQPPKPPAGLARNLVTPQSEITAALADLQTIPREEQTDTRYVSLAFAHNNSKLSDPQLENLRHGARKLLNSLSTGPRVVVFPEVGPEKVLLRVRLRDIGWDAALWDRIAAHFPQAIDTGISAALGSACHATVAILPANWMAANAARPPLYNDVLRLPKLQQDLEKELGIDLVANLQGGNAARSGLVKSGISLANRLVERHEDRSRAGYYWASYDFRSSGGRANLIEFPLGPEKAHLAGGQHSFKQAGGEIVFSLPNGFHGYYLADVLGNRLDGAAPTEIVGDRTGVTGRVEISNGLSCIICHDKGIKPIDGQDVIRPVASRFSAEEQRLIERLHPEGDKFQALVKADEGVFNAAVKAANAEPVPGQPESVGALATLFDGEVTIESAAAEIGLSVDDLRRKLDDQNQLFALRASFKDGGTLQREHFLDYFADLVERLDIGRVRRDVQPVAFVPLPGRTAAPRPIPVELKTDKTTYTEGEELVVTVQAAESGHLRLLYQNAAGEISTLFPNQFVTDDRIDGGHPVKVVPVPNPKKAGDEVAIQIAGPHFGTEYLAAIVTDLPFTDEAALNAELKKTEFAKSAARDIEGAITKSARVITRAAKEDGAGGARAGFARVTLTTIKK